MTSQEHAVHIKSRVSHSNCSECRADTERRFVDTQVWRYDHVHEYLEYVRPRLGELKSGKVPAIYHTHGMIWMRRFLEALERRITLKVAERRSGRKYCDSYLERFRQFPRDTDAAYLRRFARRGASCLDS